MIVWRWLSLDDNEKRNESLNVFLRLWLKWQQIIVTVIYYTTY